jgi:2'-5' RNA ligase
MMTFKEMIEQENTHPDGTYIATQLSKESKKLLDDYVTSLDIQNAADPDQYHSTVIYSRKGVPESVNYPFALPFKAKVKEWKLFPTQTGTKALVAIMDSPELEKAHKDIRTKYGATHDYPDYHPHVTISYDHLGDLPSEIPDMELEYDDIEAKPLNPTFVPAKK